MHKLVALTTRPSLMGAPAVSIGIDRSATTPLAPRSTEKVLSARKAFKSPTYQLDTSSAITERMRMFAVEIPIAMPRSSVLKASSVQKCAASHAKQRQADAAVPNAIANGAEEVWFKSAVLAIAPNSAA
mmetsp:Transcript_8774/g.22138  ORF Transcript_8774/g.22138 Transcript_8774/m.22138 type:complete len:129 (+) Transcript_8774:15-401(+)